MARLPFIRPQDIPSTHPDIAARKADAFAVLAHSLDGTRAMLSLGRYMRDGSRLDPRLRELAILQVGCLVGARYEFYHHVKIGFDFGVTEADVDAVIAETRGERTALGQLERAVLRMARQLTGELRLDGDTFAFLEQSLGREQLVDLALIIGHYNSVVRLIACFEVDLEPGYENLVRRFPLPA